MKNKTALFIIAMVILIGITSGAAGYLYYEEYRYRPILSENSELYGQLITNANTIERLESEVEELNYWLDAERKVVEPYEGFESDHIVRLEAYIKDLESTIKELKDNPAIKEVPTYIQVSTNSTTRKLLKGWRTLEELRQFIYFDDDTNELNFVSEGMNASFLYAARLRLNAEKIDRLISIQYVLEDDTFLCHAIVGEGIFYIDPQTDKIWWVTDWR